MQETKQTRIEAEVYGVGNLARGPSLLFEQFSNLKFSLSDRESISKSRGKNEDGND